MNLPGFYRDKSTMSNDREVAQIMSEDLDRHHCSWTVIDVNVRRPATASLPPAVELRTLVKRCEAVKAA